MAVRRLMVLNVVGLTPALLRHAPALSALAAQGASRPLTALLPAVTCSMQATFLTGLPPSGHGVVGNGWYFRDLAEIWLWRQSNHLVAGEKLWETARRLAPGFTCAKMFWWYNMYSSADWSVTPRPIYRADGRKIPDAYSHPAGLRDELTDALGRFPLFRFWGPAADIASTRWIAQASLHVFLTRRPGLTLVYLPHLDYALQKLGPDHPAIAAEVAALDAECRPLLQAAQDQDVDVVVLSEYGITPVSGPVHLNRALRRAGYLAVRREGQGEVLDPGASAAFALADHQVAHVYVRDPGQVATVRLMLEGVEGVEQVLDRQAQAAVGLNHPRSGELVAVAAADRWFTYYPWLDDVRAPDFARTVDIHRKPGYDPAELFLDPALRLPRLAVGWRLAKKALGLRSLMDVIPLEAGLVRGSHGRPTDRAEAGPLLISSRVDLLPEGPVAAVAVRDLLLQHMFGSGCRDLGLRQQRKGEAA